VQLGMRMPSCTLALLLVLQAPESTALLVTDAGSLDSDVRAGTCQCGVGQAGVVRGRQGTNILINGSEDAGGGADSDPAVRAQQIACLYGHHTRR